MPSFFEEKKASEGGRGKYRIWGLLLLLPLLLILFLVSILPVWKESSLEKEINAVSQGLDDTKTLLKVAEKELKDLEKHWDVSPLRTHVDKLHDLDKEFALTFYEVAKPYLSRSRDKDFSSRKSVYLAQIEEEKLKNLSRNLVNHAASVKRTVNHIHTLNSYTQKAVRATLDARAVYEALIRAKEENRERRKEIQAQAESFQSSLNQGEFLLKKGIQEMLTNHDKGGFIVEQACRKLADLALRGERFLQDLKSQ